ncbi:MAG: polysaccharide biosynthesis tyrosine autokinase [Algibacter sp.]
MSEFEFDHDGYESGSMTFDFKGFLFKLISNWILIIVSLGIAFFIAYFVNDRKQNVYRLESLISVEKDQNPFFTANTSISFNWGGVSDQVGKIITTLQTRKHNTKVVDSLQFYINYLEEGKYRKNNIYKESPFFVQIDKKKSQVLNIPIGVHFINDTQFRLFVTFDSEYVSVQQYEEKSIKNINIEVGVFDQTFSIDEVIELPFFNGIIKKRLDRNINSNSEYFISFSSFDGVVNRYKTAVIATPFSKDSPSVLRLSLTGLNKGKIVDYLNTTTSVLSSSELERKNLYATNTIKFIDSSLNAVSIDLKGVTGEMDSFRKNTKVFNVDEEMLQVSSKLQDFELEKEVENKKLNYLYLLEEYLNKKTNYLDITAPTSVGIEEVNIINSVAKINGLSIERQNLESIAKEGSELFKPLDRKITSEKSVLLEIIKATKRTINSQIEVLNNRIGSLQNKLGKLPESQQNYLRIQRKLDISQETYNVYLAKRSEAAIVKAANVSDISVIDAAKDVGEGPVGPNRRMNYLMALLLGVFVPAALIFIVFLLDNSIHGAEDVERLSKIPILGLIGKEHHENNLVVFEKPKSAVAESFRAIRSSLEFVYKRQDESNSKVLLLTSSVSGEGKTFCSINIATAYALSGKKTILLGLDLRKPKIVGDFNIPNKKGMVNYLINELAFKDIVYKSHIKNLDIVPSGPVPPNPSELLMGSNLSNLMKELRANYDIIVLDTPPLGLVTDALDLMDYADASLFVIRLNYTKKGMLGLINNKHKTGEVKNTSFLLNYYKHKSIDKYGYGYGYSYGYGIYGSAYHEKSKKQTLTNRIISLIEYFKKRR